MEISNINVLFAAHYAAPYKGNFIRSLERLELTLNKSGCHCSYLLPPLALQRDWIEDFKVQHDVHFADPSADKTEFNKILALVSPDIIHTHFEGYDIPLYKSLKRTHSHAPIIWHMHDHFEYLRHPLRVGYQMYTFFLHYGIPLIHSRLTGGVKYICCQFVKGCLIL